MSVTPAKAYWTGISRRPHAIIEIQDRVGQHLLAQRGSSGWLRRRLSF